MTMHVCYCLLILLVGAAWWTDHAQLRHESDRWQANFNFIDPIRWEAEGFTDSERKAATIFSYALDLDKPELEKLVPFMQRLLDKASK